MNPLHQWWRWWRLLFGVAFGLPLIAWADGNVSPGNATAAVYSWKVTSYCTALAANNYTTFGAAVSACTAARQAGNPGWSCFTLSSSDNGATGSAVHRCTKSGEPNSDASATYAYQITTPAAAAGCPANSTASGGSCVCAASFKPDAAGRACVSVAATGCQSLVDGANYLGLDGAFRAPASPGSVEFCSGGCYIRGTGATFYKDGAGVMQGQFYGPFEVAGASCPSQAPAAGASEAPQCPRGQVPGTVNGQAVCAPGGTTTDRGSSVSTNGSGQSTGTRESTTTCTGDQCSTITTSRDGSGAITDVTRSDTPRARFCEDNPDTTICQKSTFSGGCSAGFTCSGDAVTCAMAREQHVRNCALYDATGAVRDTGQAALDRGDTRASDHPGAPGNIVSTAVGNAQDTTDLLPGSCPADVTVAVGSGSVVLPWSKLCTPASWLGALLVGLTSLAWVFIAFKQG